MAHKTRINGTNYSITGGKTKIGGTNYSVKGGKTLVGGTVRTISFGPELVEFCIFNDYMVPMECFFTADVGMTWEDWINSDYVTPNDWGVTNGDFEIRNNLVYLNRTRIQYFNGNTMEYENVYAADVISDFESGAAGIWFAVTGGSFTVLSSGDSIYTWDIEDIFNCDPGMTWEEWIESDYNTYGWIIDGESLMGFCPVRPSMSSDYAIFSSNLSAYKHVASSDEITIGGTYYLENEIYM